MTRSPPQVSVVVVTRNEAHNIARCLDSVCEFDDVWVVDSNSHDGTCTIAQRYGANIIGFKWNGRYPKKRQWCLDTVSFKYDYILFLDADEVLSAALRDEIKRSDFQCDGYFLTSHYSVKGKILKHGLRNQKLCLFHRHRFHFPVVNDLNIAGMGEIEGHYQPVAMDKSSRIGHLKNIIIHHAFDDEARWNSRHDGYAQWEDEMRIREAYPHDVSHRRRVMKAVFHALPPLMRGVGVFIYGYGFRLGVLDGAAGYYVAAKKAHYYLRKKR